MVKADTTCDKSGFLLGLVCPRRLDVELDVIGLREPFGVENNGADENADIHVEEDSLETQETLNGTDSVDKRPMVSPSGGAGEVYKLPVNGVQRQKAWKGANKDVLIAEAHSDSIIIRFLFANWKWISLLFFCCSFGETYGDIIVAPSNVAVLEGERTTFGCMTNVKEHRLKWFVSDFSSSEEIEIWNGYDLLDDIKNTTAINMSIDGQFDLIINVTKLAAKRYICKEPGTLQTRSAKLLVLESEPECSLHKSVSNLNITCTVNYTGNWSPIMEWFQFDGTQNHTITPMIEVTNNNVISRLLINASGIVSSRSYFVTTKFSATGRPQETDATNIPYYNFTNVILYFTEEPSKTSIPESVGLYASLAALAVLSIIALIVAVAIYRRCTKMKRKEQVSIELQIL